MWVAATVSRVVLLYLGCGLLFGSAFVSAGAAKVDGAARGTSVLFRLLILPGTVALWPVLTARWIEAWRRGDTP